MKFTMLNSPAGRSFRKTAFLLAGLCCTLACWPAPPANAVMSYDQALAQAVAQEARHKAEEQDAQATKAQGWQAIAGMGPTLSAHAQPSLNEDRLKRNPDTAQEYAGEDRSTSYHDMELGLTLRQPLLDLERIHTARQGSRRFDLAALMQQKAYEDLAVRIAEQYYATLAAEETHAIRQAEEETLAQQVAAARERKGLGYGTIIDVYDAEARLELAKASTIAGWDELDSARLALMESLHQNELEQLNPSPSVQDLPRRDKDLTSWQQQAQQHNAELQIRLQQAEIARLEHLALLGRFAPRLGAVGSYIYNNPSKSLYYDSEEKESEAYIGLRLEMDLLAGGADTAAAVAANKRLQAARYRTEESRRAVARSVQSLWNSLGSTYNLAQAYEKSVLANQQALESTKEGYREGVKVLLDVLDAQQKYYNALNQSQAVRNNYMVLYQKFMVMTGQKNPVKKEES